MNNKDPAFCDIMFHFLERPVRYLVFDSISLVTVRFVR